MSIETRKRVRLEIGPARDSFRAAAMVRQFVISGPGRAPCAGHPGTLPGPPFSFALRAICDIKNPGRAPACPWVPRTPGGRTGLEIGAF